MQKSPTDRVKQEFKKLENPAKAKLLARFFKTGKGEYGEGDRFYGVTVPQTRAIAKKYANGISFLQIRQLLETGRHEERLCMLLILVENFKKAAATTAAGQAERKKIFDFYIANTAHINNWDLVDVTAGHIVGAYLAGKSKKILEKLARSKNLWERRIAIISTFHDIYEGDYAETFKIADILLHDEHDLIHKAVGWMLREVGKRCGEATLEAFLKPRYKHMPRTMLRYAIERFGDKKRQRYLA